MNGIFSSLFPVKKEKIKRSTLYKPLESSFDGNENKQKMKCQVHAQFPM